MKITSFRIVLVYFLVAAAYIVLSDKLLAYLVRDIDQLANIQLYKGLFFVLSTSVLLYFLIKASTNNLRHEKMEALANERKYKLLFNNNPLPMWVYDDTSGEFLDVNQTAIQIYGYSREEFSVLKLEDIQPENTPSTVTATHNKQSHAFFQNTGIWQHNTKDGSAILAEVFSHTVEYKGRNARMILAHDVSEIIKSEKDLNTSINELNNFVYRASHDLRGPIARMIGLSELGKNTRDLHASLDYFGLISQTAHKMDKSLQRLLVINSIRGRELELSEVSVAAVVDTALSSYRSEFAEQNIGLKIEDDERLTAFTDKYFIKVALENIIENCIMYRAPERLRIPEVNISISKIESNLSIKVSDNGIGIKKNVRDKIFTLFYRGTEESKGSGLGLYLASRALERVQGTLTLAPDSGHHTTFVITVPVAISSGENGLNKTAIVSQSA